MNSSLQINVIFLVKLPVFQKTTKWYLKNFVPSLGQTKKFYLKGKAH